MLDQVKAFLQELEITQNLSQEDIHELATFIEIQDFNAQDIILQEGIDGNAIYFVYRGVVDVLKSGNEGSDMSAILNTIKQGGFFGEISYIEQEPTTATVQARTPVTVFILRRDALPPGPLFYNVFASITKGVLFRLRETIGLYSQSLQSSMLEDSSIFEVLSREERCQVETLLETKTYRPGQIILEEGENPLAIYFIQQGIADVLKSASDDEELLVIANIHKGDYFGEMSFASQWPASATIRAKTDVVVSILQKATLKPCLGYQKIMAGIHNRVIARLRALSDSYARSLRQRLREQKIRTEFGQLYVVTTIIFGISSFVPTTYYTMPPLQQIGVSWGMLFAIFLPIAYFFRRQKAPLSTFGITREGLKKSVLEGMLLAIPLIPLAIILKSLSQPDEPLWTWRTFAEYSQFEFYFYLLTYTVHTFIQEFISRGVLQTSLARFMPESHFLVPILIVSLIFSILHLYVSIFFALLVLIVSFIFGLIYHRHQNIAGVFLFHYIIGLVSMALGFN